MEQEQPLFLCEVTELQLLPGARLDAAAVALLRLNCTLFSTSVSVLFCSDGTPLLPQPASLECIRTALP